MMKIGRYEMISTLGEGAMGMVYHARDPLIEREVAIKTVLISLLQQEGADVESRFLREAQSAGRLSHPNIVTIYDVGEADGFAYIAMEYLAGDSLRNILDKCVALPLDLALDTALQMAEALAFAHEHGVIHRDIKPANVVLTGKKGRIKLTDFGIAHLVNSNHTQTGQMLGSPRYMSPEQAMGRDLDGRSDIFSLGVVLYEMLTGHYAFTGDSLPTIVYRVISEHPVPAASLCPQLPDALVQLLTRMLSKKPEHRPDARALIDALKTMRPEAPVPLPPPAKTPRILPILAFGTPIAVLLLIGIGLIVIEHFLPPQLAPGSQIPPVAQPSPAAKSGTRAPGAVAAPASIADAPREPPPAPPAAPKTPDADAYLIDLDNKRRELRIKRTELLLKYTELHPDVVSIDRQLAQLRDERRAHLRQLRRQ